MNRGQNPEQNVKQDKQNESDSDLSGLQNESSTQNTQLKTETSFLERECNYIKKGKLETVRETNSEFSYKKGLSFEENRNFFSKKNSLYRGPLPNENISEDHNNINQNNIDKPIEGNDCAYKSKVHEIKNIFEKNKEIPPKSQPHKFSTEVDQKIKKNSYQKQASTENSDPYLSSDKHFFSKYKFIFEDDVSTKIVYNRRFTCSSKK